MQVWGLIKSLWLSGFDCSIRMVLEMIASSVGLGPLLICGLDLCYKSQMNEGRNGKSKDVELGSGETPTWVAWRTSNGIQFSVVPFWVIRRSVYFWWVKVLVMISLDLAGLFRISNWFEGSLSQSVQIGPGSNSLWTVGDGGNEWRA